MHLLIVEDDPHLADVVRRGLERQSHTSDIADNGEDGLLLAQLRDYDAIVLDIMLPGMDGLRICRTLRQEGSTTPILLLTARDAIDDVVKGLEAGADDYLTKPFAMAELRARLQSIMRRASGAATSRLTVGDICLDLATRQVWHGESQIELANREYQVLEYLMYNRGKVLSRSMIEEHVWGYDYEGVSNTVDVHIRRLRSKLDRPEAPSVIETVRNAGYRLRTNQ